MIDGNAMIRARTAGPGPFAGARLRQGRFAGLDAAAPPKTPHAIGEDGPFGSADFTVDLWFRSEATYLYPCLLNKSKCGVPGDQSFALWLNHGSSDYGKVEAAFTDETQTDHRVRSTSTVNDGAWHHIAYVRDRAQQKAYIFIDGIKAGERNLSNSVSVNQIANVLGVGIQGAYTGTLFNGYIDEVRVSKGVARWTEDFTPPATPY